MVKAQGSGGFCGRCTCAFCISFSVSEEQSAESRCLKNPVSGKVSFSKEYFVYFKKRRQSRRADFAADAEGALFRVYQQKTPCRTAGRKTSKLASSFVTAGFGTLHTQVAGFHRAVPSTALDKVFSFYVRVL